jgi:type IV secretion system protein TrbL
MLKCATIILAVISHRLPQMVAGMVVGGGHNGAIGGVGIMTLFAAALAAANMAGRMAANPAAALATEGVAQGAKMLEDRIAVAEAAMGAQRTQGSMSADTSGSGSGSSATGGSSSTAGGMDLRSWYGRRSRSRSATNAGGKTTVAGAAGSGSTGGAQPGGGGKTTPAEPPLERPMSADEARGFGPDGNGGSDN